MIRLSINTKLIGTINNVLTTFSVSDLVRAAAEDRLYQYKIYETSDPDVECELVSISEISPAGNEYTYSAKSESGQELVLPRSSHVVSYTDDVLSSAMVYQESSLINAKYFVGKYHGLRTTMSERIVVETSFGGSEPVYQIPGNLVLTSANSLVIGL